MRHRRPESQLDGYAARADRGAVLMIMVALLLILMVLAGLAVDISAKENRAQELQNAADAAALAGAQVWADGDQVAAEAATYEILAQNGIEAEFVDSIDFPTSTTVTVTLRDDTGGGILSPFTGGLSHVDRTATASHIACSQGCDQIVEAPPIFRPIEALGSGDGFIPIPIGDRLYAVNHHENGIACVDKLTQLRCWPTNPAAFDDPTMITADVHHPTVIGTKIYYVGHDGYNQPDWWSPPSDVASADLVLACFETATDTPCSTTVTLSGEGFGILANINDELHVFTGSRKVFCYSADLVPCADHSSAMDTQATPLAGWELDTVSVVKSDLKVVGNKAYYTMSDNGATWVQCWDAASRSTCSAFGPVFVPGTGVNWWSSGRKYKVVLGRSATGVEQDFCVVGFDDVSCWDLATGSPSTGMETDLDQVRSLMRSNGWSAAWSGVSSYHPPTNQVYLVDSNQSRSYCFSFTTSTVCGDSDDSTAIGDVHTYGYIEDSPSCLIGLGDTSIFFSMKPDLSGPCDSSGGFVDITSCTCLGEAVWPRIEAFSVDGVVEFNIRVETPDGTEIVPWTDILVDEIDLTTAPNVAFLRAHFNVVVDGVANPWFEGNPPRFAIIGEEDVPHLVD